MSDYEKQLEERIKKLEEAVLRRQNNQIQLPLDEMSKSVLSTSVGLVSSGSGSFGTQNIVVSSTPQTITVPAQPSGTIKVIVNGIAVELLKK